MCHRLSLLCLLLAAALPAAAQQRIEFQRQKFDRSRFERAGPAATQPATPALESPAAPAPEPAAPAFPAAPAPMVTQTPAAPAAPAAAPTAPTGTVIFSADAPPLPPGPPPVSYPAGITPEEKAAYDTPLFDAVPSKWYDNAKDHEELAALSKKTGACMLVYFKNFAVPNEKGLCNWFEKTVTTDIKWRKAMKYYIKLEINVPGNSVVEELIAKYRANKTPAVFVVKPGSTMGTRIQVFDYPAGSRPEPRTAEVVLESVKTASTPAYQTLF